MIQLIVRAGSGASQPSLSYAAVDLDCWGAHLMLWAPRLSSLLLSSHKCHHFMSLPVHLLSPVVVCFSPLHFCRRSRFPPGVHMCANGSLLSVLLSAFHPPQPVKTHGYQPCLSASATGICSTVLQNMILLWNVTGFFLLWFGAI